jgi:hypothetical protein
MVSAPPLTLANGGVRFVVGVDAGSDADVARELAEAARESGADGVTLFSPLDTGLLSHLRADAGADFDLYFVARTPDMCAAAVDAGATGVRFEGLHVTHPSMQQALPAGTAALVTLVAAAPGDVFTLLDGFRAHELTLLYALPSRVAPTIDELAFFLWLRREVPRLGFADNAEGPLFASAAALLGAHMVERRYTSREPAKRVRALVRQHVREVRRILSADADQLDCRSPEDVDELEDARPSLAAAGLIPRGTVISPAMLTLRAPMTGLAPECVTAVVGRRALYDIPAGEFVTFGMLSP